uniref:Uncharacterized protein n=1 Tax=Amphimedon queenslandica TaxID=400682 RepID=A0A1X7TVU8_AMPQE
MYSREGCIKKHLWKKLETGHTHIRAWASVEFQLRHWL